MIWNGAITTHLGHWLLQQMGQMPTRCHVPICTAFLPVWGQMELRHSAGLKVKNRWYITLTEASHIAHYYTLHGTTFTLDDKKLNIIIKYMDQERVQGTLRWLLPTDHKVFGGFFFSSRWKVTNGEMFSHLPDRWRGHWNLKSGESLRQVVLSLSPKIANTTFHVHCKLCWSKRTQDFHHITRMEAIMSIMSKRHSLGQQMPMKTDLSTQEPEQTSNTHTQQNNPSMQESWRELPQWKTYIFKLIWPRPIFWSRWWQLSVGRL